MPTNLENSAVATGLQKVSFHPNAKECSNHHTIALISHTSKIMLKFLHEMFKLLLEKAEEPEIKLPTSAGPWEKEESFMEHK